MRDEKTAQRTSPHLAFMAILSQPMREKILTVLYENVELSYTELLNLLNVDEGLLNFHLRKMKQLVKTTAEGTYVLSEYGKLAYNTLFEVKEKIGAIRKGKSGDYTEIAPPAILTPAIVVRRVTAFVLDAAILFASTGLFLDRNVVALLDSLVRFQSPSFSLIDLSYETVSAYSHVFFAAYLIFTVLEAYKGQTPGKFLLGIRVVKVGGKRITLMDSAVRNIGKVFLLPLDIAIGILFYAKKGYLRFFDHYTGLTVERAIIA